VKIARPTDRRRHPRFPFHGHASLRRGDTGWPVRLLDVSRRGALVVVPEAWCGEPGSRYELVIPVVPGAEYVRAEAVVRRRAGRLVGLACDALDLSSLVALSRLVDLNLGSPELLGRDLKDLLSERA
jgi:hypothetical protein